MMMRDPFANDPFFANSGMSGGGMGSMSKMMEGMNKRMSDMMQGFGDSDFGGGHGGQMSFSSSQMGGSNGGKFMK
jgi:hypothetical protein